MHIKDFLGWSNRKQYIDRSYTGFYIREREIWWCALGINIGVEIDGKNGQFERPVIILKFMGKDMVLVVPLTTKGFMDKNHLLIRTAKTDSFAKITQIRTVSSKRFLRKIDTLDEEQFKALRRMVRNLLK